MNAPVRAVARLVVVTAVLLGAALPAAAQYGGGPNLFVDPVRIEVGSSFDAFGNSCPPGSTVTLTIDGIPRILGTSTAQANGIYLFDDVPAPPEFVPGVEYVVRADCGGGTATFVVAAVCVGGQDPINGSCDGGLGSIPTTTSTIPGGGPGGPGGPGDPGDPGDGSATPDGTGGSSSSPGLAFTGLSQLTLTLQIGVSLIAAGVVFALLGRRRSASA